MDDLLPSKMERLAVITDPPRAEASLANTSTKAEWRVNAEIWVCPGMLKCSSTSLFTRATVPGTAELPFQTGPRGRVRGFGPA